MDRKKITHKADIQNWTLQEVCDWIKSLKLEASNVVFLLQSNFIDGNQLAMIWGAEVHPLKDKFLYGDARKIKIAIKQAEKQRQNLVSLFSVFQ